MVLISKRALFTLGIIIAAITVFLGIYGYHLVAQSGANEGAVFRAQQLLYAAILCVVAEALLILRIALRSRNIGRELDKLIEITRFRGLSHVGNLSRLGPIGNQISQLYDQLNSLSERRSLKISSLSELAEFLMNNVSVPAVAATVDGTVVYVSRVFVERNKRPRNELIESRLEELAPGIVLSEVIVELDRSHSSIQRKSERGELTFYPIRNSANQLAYIVCVFQAQSALVEQIYHAVADQSARRSPSEAVRRLLDLGGRFGRSRRSK